MGQEHGVYLLPTGPTFPRASTTLEGSCPQLGKGHGRIWVVAEARTLAAGCIAGLFLTLVLGYWPLSTRCSALFTPALWPRYYQQAGDNIGTLSARRQTQGTKSTNQPTMHAVVLARGWWWWWCWWWSDYCWHLTDKRMDDEVYRCTRKTTMCITCTCRRAGMTYP